MGKVADAALKYLDFGFSVIPLGLDKRPMLSSWRSFQKRHPLESQVRSWFEQWPDAGVGIVTGWLSRLVVVDLDSDKAVEHVRKQMKRYPPTVKTGKGWHLYYRYPAEKEIRNSVNADIGLDIRGDGGYVVAPPSIHPSGRKYEWSTTRHLWNTQMPVLPEFLIDERPNNYQGNETDQPHWAVEMLVNGIPEGGRNQAVAKLAGRFILKGLGEREVLELLFMWNSRNNPPLGEREIETTVASIMATHRRKKK
jgi:hypothetical protein